MYLMIFLLLHFNVYLNFDFESRSDGYLNGLYYGIGYCVILLLVILAILMTFLSFRCVSNTKNHCHVLECHVTCNFSKQKHYIKISKDSDLIEIRYRADYM